MWATITCLNANREGRANAEGVFGQRMEYDGGKALPSRIVNLGLDGEPERGCVCGHIT